MSTSDFDPNLMKVVPPSETQGYDLWARDNAQAIAQQQANIYRMQLTAQQMAERQIEMARLQQAAAEQQARYAHGWHDARSIHATPMMVSSTDAVYKVKAKLQRPKLKPHYVLFCLTIAFVSLAIILKAML